ncbi:MAG: hypothetical protein JWO06_3573 [Bacteroidota bacterium]|nr:hypothetical protein [Bacteroidota bacterium]
MKRKMLMSLLLIFFFMPVIFNSASAQGWEKKYAPDVMMGINSLYQLPNYTYLTSGADYTGTKQRLMNIDFNGNIIWQQDYDSLGLAYTNIAQNQGYVMLGITANDSSHTNNRTFNLLKVNSTGQKLWLRPIHNAYYPDGQSTLGDGGVDTTNNGGFICTINPYDSSTDYHFYHLVVKRIDSTGNVLWSHSYFDADSNGLRYSYDIRNSKDGGFLVAFRDASNGPNAIFKIDSAGTLLWTYNEPFANAGIIASIAQDGNILITGDGYIGKLDQNGNVLHLHQYPALQNSMGWNQNLVELSGGRYAILADHASGGANNGFTFNFTEADSQGNVLLQKPIPIGALGISSQLFMQGFRNLSTTNDGGFLMGGWMTQDANNNSAFLIKLDRTGAVYPVTISGYTYFDANNNCVKDTGEIDVSGTIISFSNSSDTFSTAVSAQGYYVQQLDTGNYNVSMTLPSSYWGIENCGNTQINLPSNTDSVISFALKAIVNYPYLVLDANNIEGSCTSSSIYTVQYCNTGTAAFTGILDITLDSLMVFDSISSPLLSQTGNQYQFAVDTLDILQCGTLTVYYHVPCGLHISGHTLCINAHAHADTVIIQSPSWDQSNLEVKATCNYAQDSVVFTLKNKGTGNMQQLEKMIVIEDNVILLNGPVQLNAGQMTVITQRLNGSTWRVTVPQTPLNPYSAFTTAASENCGLSTSHLGFVNQFPVNGFYGFDHTLCSVVGGSFDPNHKSVVPEGAEPDHIIDSTTLLEYTISFQNTGTAPAYMVRLIDTLAPYLDPLTIRPGISSFPYTVDFMANNIVAFTFTNIDLPDTAQSQTASTGYVKFKIRQYANNTNGTVINNDAAIFFDYNAPIITNTATVTIGQLFVTDIQNLYDEKALMVNAYPNPFTTETNIKVTGSVFKEMELNVYDLSGRTVSTQHVANTDQFILGRNTLSSGSYIFEISAHDKMIARGKIVAR